MSEVTDQSWYVAERWQQFDGERRANLLRVAAVSSFYFIHLLNHFGWLGALEIREGNEQLFHQAITLLAVVWGVMAVGVNLSLQQRVFPWFLPYLTTAVDGVLLTAMICTGSGQQSPLVIAYLLVIILAALRMSLPLIRFATAVSLVGYLFLLALTKWFGSEDFAPDQRVPRYAQIMTLLAIAMSGMMLGQLIRRVRQMAVSYAQREAIETGASS